TYFDGLAQVIRKPEHWIYQGTDLHEGDLLAHVTGREWDRVMSLDRSPKSLEVIAHTEGINKYARQLGADVTLYYPTPTSLVFAAGSLIWGNAFGQPGSTDLRIQRMMDNLLFRVGISGFELTEVPIMPRSVPQHPVSAFAGSGVVGGDDGSAS